MSKPLTSHETPTPRTNKLWAKGNMTLGAARKLCKELEREVIRLTNNKTCTKKPTDTTHES